MMCTLYPYSIIGMATVMFLCAVGIVAIVMKFINGDDVR